MYEIKNLAFLMHNERGKRVLGRNSNIVYSNFSRFNWQGCPDEDSKKGVSNSVSQFFELGSL